MEHRETALHDRRWSPVVIPARVRLSSLEPIGVGTADCESLPGYIGRLASIHGVSACALVEYVRELPPCEGERYAMNIGYKLYWGVTPGLFAMRLAQLTGVPSVAVLGMPWADHTITFRNCTRQNAVWCSACWRDDIDAGRPRYDRLLWKFSLYAHCHWHGLKLESACASCGSSSHGGLTGSIQVDACSHCGGDLQGSKLDSQSREAVQASPSRQEACAVKLMADLVTMMPAFGEGARWPRLDRALRLCSPGVSVKDRTVAQRAVSTYHKQLVILRQPEYLRSSIGFGTVINVAVATRVPITKLFKAGCRKADFK